MNAKSYLLKCKFETPVLGSQPTKDVASEFLAKRAGIEGIPEDELESLRDVLENGTTVFHRDSKGRPCLFDYQVKGFIKEAGKTFNGLRGVKNLRSKIDSYVFVYPRMILLRQENHTEMEYLERPLRAETMQGPRVALARSEMLAAGTRFEVVVDILEPGPITVELLQDLVSYGERKGLGQWRNGGYGRFVVTSWTELEIEGEEEEGASELVVAEGVDVSDATLVMAEV